MVSRSIFGVFQSVFAYGVLGTLKKYNLTSRFKFSSCSMINHSVTAAQVSHHRVGLVPFVSEEVCILFLESLSFKVRVTGIVGCDFRGRLASDFSPYSTVFGKTIGSESELVLVQIC